MLMPIRHSMTRMPKPMRPPIRLRWNLLGQNDILSIICPKILKPISTIPEGVMPSWPGVDGRPPADAPSWESDCMIDTAKLGPLMSSHQKKPVKIVNRTNSAKNSPMSALRKAIMPNVQTIEITTSVQNSQEAALVMTDCQPVAALWNRRKMSS